VDEDPLRLALQELPPARSALYRIIIGTTPTLGILGGVVAGLFGAMAGYLIPVSYGLEWLGMIGLFAGLIGGAAAPSVLLERVHKRVVQRALRESREVPRLTGSTAGAPVASPGTASTTPPD
jgi:hypothetical protein